MRILAVRGENLASLAEPFAIDLSAEPLAGAGLFAITGETGAGKSTLLDAICLALYGKYPRIQADGGDEDLPDVLDDVIRARDPRSILRRGASQGYCEVDFVGVDGLAYRATWRVYRARGRAGGRLQKAARHLVRIDGDGVALATVAEQIQAMESNVQRLTDLTFEQFRRTVLLAQGDFDAFLRSGESERADLLEKITGTEIYADLSRRAYALAKDKARIVDLLEARRTEIGLLDAAERDRRLARRGELEAMIATIDARMATVRTALAHLDDFDEAHARLVAAEEEAAIARAAEAEAEADRDRLDRIRRARRMRPILDDFTTAAGRHAEARRRLIEVDTRLAEITPAFRVAREARDAARARHDALAEEVRRLTPVWQEAARLDTEIAGEAREVERAAATAARDEASLARARTRLDDLMAERERIAAEFVRLEAEIEAVPALAAVTDRWEEVEARLGERAGAVADRDEAAGRATAADAAIATILARLAEIERDGAADAARRAALDERLAAKRAAHAAVDVAALEARDAAAGRLLGLAARAEPVATGLEAAAADLAEAETVLAALAAETETRRGDRATAAARLEAAIDRRRGQAAAVALADAVASSEAARLRAGLVDGAPCPVCGALDHPVTADPSIHAALTRVRADRAAVEAEIATLETDLRRRDTGLADLAARTDATARRRANAAAAIARDTPRLADLVHRLAEATSALGLAAPEPIPRAAALATLVAEVEAARATVAAELARARGLAAEIAALQSEIETLAAAREARHLRREADGAALGRARGEAAAAREAERQSRVRLAEADGRLAPRLAPLGIGPGDLDRDGAAIAAKLAADVAAHRVRERDRALRVAEIAALERAREGALADLANAERAVTTADAALAGRRDRLGALETARATLLGGEPTAIHRETHINAFNAAEAAVQTARTTLDRIRSDHDAALAQREERHAAVGVTAAEMAERDAARTRALAAADLDLATALDLAALADDIVADLVARLEGLGERRRAAETTLEARTADLAALTAAAPPPEDIALERERLNLRLRTETEAASVAQRELGALQEGLDADDRARASALALEDEIAAATATRKVWADVDDAIGSSDGAKFRRFAQGVTLDRLTALANHHLATLNPRYRLMRTEGLGLAIIDRDMGDEVRSTRSLSGGERFLASLALALALSGLEGRRSFVDTLFIDEGFGSLDAATLDVAIDALESLQSEGRKVGVISHVAAMHDRIPVQIRVEKAGVGRSRVSVTAEGGSA